MKFLLLLYSFFLFEGKAETDSLSAKGRWKLNINKCTWKKKNLQPPDQSMFSFLIMLIDGRYF